jgi:hypothetical protein
VSDEILLEYKRVMGRLGVRRPVIGKIINLLCDRKDYAREMGRSSAHRVEHVVALGSRKTIFLTELYFRNWKSTVLKRALFLQPRT